MGVVYLGTRVSDGALVAVKFIHRHLAQDEGLRARFDRESRALAALEHPNIVRHLDGGEQEVEGESAAKDGKAAVERVPFLVMEFVDGMDLRHELLSLRREGKAMPLERVLETATALCRALAVAHAAGLLHRDIKPANILTGPDGVVKLADFGMVAMEAGGDAALTASRVAGGAHFTGPELERTGRGDERADIYSVGAVMFAMLAGEPPRFGGGAPSELRQSDEADSPERLGMLDRIVLKALHLDPGKRFASAEEMLGELERVEGAEEGGGVQPGVYEGNGARVSAGGGDGAAFSSVETEERSRPVPAAAVLLRKRLPRWLKLCAGLVLVAGLSVAGGIWWTKRWTDRWEKSLEPDQKALALPGAVLLQPGRVAVPLPPPPEGSPPPVAMENSLGMKFRPFPRSEALMCIWETRIRDYKVHADATPTAGEPEWMKETGFTYDGLEAMKSMGPDGWKIRGGTWRKPGWEIEDDLPVAGPCWLDAAGFCTWLTWEERRTGRIRQDQAYRLPTDEEWSAAAGLPMEPGATAEEREASWPSPVHFWIWGPSWPPPEGVVNAAGEELKKEGLPLPRWDTLTSSDPWKRVAPVEALPASALGFFHLCGNVEEWTESFASGEGAPHYILRGSSWSRGNPRSLTLNKRVKDRGVVRMDYRGFRVVFQPKGAEGWRYSGAEWRERR